MELFELLRKVVDVCEHLGISYLVTGSVVAMAFGEPRLTNDIDIVAGIEEKHLRDITGILKISGEMVNRDYITEWAKQLDLIEVWNALQEKVAKKT